MNISSILSTILGGLLAIAGGFVATYFSQKMANKAEKKKVIREKIEELYNLSGNIEEKLYEAVMRIRELYRKKTFVKSGSEINDINLEIEILRLKSISEINLIINKIEVISSLYAKNVKKPIIEYNDDIGEYCRNFLKGTSVGITDLENIQTGLKVHREKLLPSLKKIVEEEGIA